MKTWDNIKLHIRHIQRWLKPNERQLRAMYRLGRITGRREVMAQHPGFAKVEIFAPPAAYDVPSPTTEGKIAAERLDSPRYIEMIRTKQIQRISIKPPPPRKMTLLEMNDWLL